VMTIMHVLMTLVTQIQDAKTLQLCVMMIMLVPMTRVTPKVDVYM
jgi:hypothetical protein